MTMHTPDALQLTSFAPLDTVGTENYLRYGASDPGRFVTASSEIAIITPKTVSIRLEFADTAGKLLYTFDDLELTRTHHEPMQTTAWSTDITDHYAHLKWVWDFYRMLSYVDLRITSTDPAPPADFLNMFGSCAKLTITVADQITQHHIIE